MMYCGIALPDDPLGEIQRVSSNSRFESMPFDVGELLACPPNTEDDIPKAAAKRSAYWFSDPQRITASIIYPPTGGMGWHTNSDLAGKRIYLSWSETGDSGMGWLNEDGTIRRDYDAPGWNIRVFDVPQWHCVFANCWRCSVGVKP